MTLPLPNKQPQHSVPSTQAASSITTSASSARIPLTTNGPRARRPENRHSETSPLLGSISASKRIPGWGTLVQQLDREQFTLDNQENDNGDHRTISESGRTDEGGKNGSHIQLPADTNDSRDPRGKSKDSPFLDMESGRASPMGDSFGKPLASFFSPSTSAPTFSWSNLSMRFKFKLNAKPHALLLLLLLLEQPPLTTHCAYTEHYYPYDHSGSSDQTKILTGPGQTADEVLRARKPILYLPILILVVPTKWLQSISKTS